MEVGAGLMPARAKDGLVCHAVLLAVSCPKLLCWRGLRPGVCSGRRLASLEDATNFLFLSSQETAKK